ncbi:MAG: hypothetical protein MK066_03005 [Crocinitomicaceae bacterium]|nr:hypothetical protein [Crocinitomicaceae bacterium]
MGQVRIKSIDVVGLKKCKPSYLFKFIECKPGVLLDSLRLNEDLQRLRNLKGVSEASYTVQIVGNEATVEIVCRESITLLPLFGFGVIKGNAWFRTGAFDVNFAGRGIEIKSFYQYNKRHSFSFQARVPYVKEDKWGGLGSFEALKFIEPLRVDTSFIFYNNDNISIEIGGIYHVNENQSFDFSLNYLLEEYDKKEGEIVSLGPVFVRNEQFAGKLVHRLKHVNFFEQYFSGWSNEFMIQVGHSLSSNRILYTGSNTTKYYKRLNKMNLAFRLKLGLSTNSQHYFTPYVLDSYFNIRGVGNRVDRGTGTISLNSEVRQTLLENGFGAIQGVLFTDVGGWRSSNGRLQDLVSLKNAKVYSGLGFRAIYKHAYKTSLRIDYGFNMLNTSQHGIIVGIGQYF